MDCSTKLNESPLYHVLASPRWPLESVPLRGVKDANLVPQPTAKTSCMVSNVTQGCVLTADAEGSVKVCFTQAL